MRQTQHDDDDLQARVAEELRWTACVNSDHIDVSVERGMVTLSGAVRTYPEKRLAVEAVFRVPGVISVTDDLVVRSEPGQHEHSGFIWDDDGVVGASSAAPVRAHTTTVHERAITLSGAGPWTISRADPECGLARAVGNRPLTGTAATLTDVRKPTSLPCCFEAKERIREALVLDALVDADTIHVETKGTEITLTGTVRSWAESNQACHAAWSVPGVTKVDNRLSVV